MLTRLSTSTIQRSAEKTARLMPVDWDEYLEAVATAYEKAPAFDPAAVPSYQALVEHIEKLFQRLLSKFEVEYVDEDPYKTSEEMVEDVTKNHRLKVFTGGPQHPLWTKDQNLKFRAVHDIFAHLYGSYRFSGKGEVGAYNRHAAMVPQAALPALFTEVVGQVAVSDQRGYFPEQKIAILPGFDYRRLGYMESTSLIRPHRRESSLKRLLARWEENLEPANTGEYEADKHRIDIEDPKTGHRLKWNGGHGIAVYNSEGKLLGYHCTGDPGEEPSPAYVRRTVNSIVHSHWYTSLRPDVASCDQARGRLARKLLARVILRLAA